MDPLLLLGLVAHLQGSNAEAGCYYDQALAVARELADPSAIRRASLYPAYLCAAQGLYVQAFVHLRAALEAAMGSYEQRVVVKNVIALAAGAALRQGRPVRAAELVGLALKRPETDPPVGWIEARRVRDHLRSALPAEELEAAPARGAALHLDQIAAELLACDTPAAFWGSELGCPHSVSQRCEQGP